MQPHSNDQCPEAGDSDGRRNAEQSAHADADRVVRAETPDSANRTVCLSATISGKGGFSL